MAKLAKSLESLFPDQREELAGSLARHFFQARDYQRALRYYTLAGDAAFRQFATAEAIDHYGKPSNAARTSNRFRVTSLSISTARRGRAYELANQFAAALENYERMVELSHSRGDQVAAALFIDRPMYRPWHPHPVLRSTKGQSDRRRSLAAGQRAWRSRR